MANQTTPLGMGRTSYARIDGYKLGRSRTSTSNATLAGIAWGSQLPIGRLAVYSAAYITRILAGEDNPVRSFALPDATGDYISDPVTGLLVKDSDPALLTNAKLNLAYLVAGVVEAGDKCDDGKCFEYQPWPIGHRDELLTENYVAKGSATAVGHHGYYRVVIGEDLVSGDRLSFADAPDNVDPAVGLVTMGVFMKAGNGVQDLPNDWHVITGGKAGTSAEIYAAGASNV